MPNDQYYSPKFLDGYLCDDILVNPMPFMAIDAHVLTVARIRQNAMSPKPAIMTYSYSMIIH
jgi:hypothetical protein